MTPPHLRPPYIRPSTVVEERGGACSLPEVGGGVQGAYTPPPPVQGDTTQSVPMMNSKRHLPDIEQWNQNSGSNVISRRARPVRSHTPLTTKPEPLHPQRETRLDAGEVHRVERRQPHGAIRVLDTLCTVPMKGSPYRLACPALLYYLSCIVW